MNMPDDIIQRLRVSARTASHNAYAPYSDFPVGAVVEDEAGNQYQGCNVESAAYGLTQCAERNALNSAIAQGVVRRRLKILLLYTAGHQVFSPCGACRQVIHELMAHDAMIVSCCDDEAFRCWTRQELLPDGFEFPGDE